MPHPLAVAALVGLIVVLALAGAAPTAWAQSDGPDVRSIGGKLQCPVCEGTSVADSPSQVAVDMREVIRRKLAAGEGESEIIQFFVDSYGPGVLREPPKTGFYSAVWWVPGLALLIGAVIIYGVVKRRRSDGSPDEANTPPELPQEEMESYRERVRELEQGGS